MTETTLEAGFLGLGQMGGAMAECLVRAGVHLHVFDPHPAAAQRLAALGAIAHPSPRSVADATALVFACLPNAKVSEAVLTGPDGVLAGSAIATYVEVSTIGAAAVERVAAAVAASGVAFLDAPISGGPAGARAGTLAIMAAGDPAALARAEPVMQRMARTIVHVGDKPGAGQIMKLVNNMLAAANLASMSEALTLGAKAGLDAGKMAAVLTASSGRSWVSEAMLEKSILTGTFDFGATIAVMDKDAALGVAEAERLGVPMWVLEQSARLWRFAMTQGMAGDDISSLIRLMEGWTGTSVRSGEVSGS